jgi:TetR/AcrR family transcriptional regulator, regulator of autoinduction and epiphytic fitness
VPETTLDGRSARAERTREKVVDALLELLDGGDARPTAERIAARAGVSERTVFQHYADREALFEAVGDRQAARVLPTLEVIPPELPLAERIDRFTKQRARLLERLSGVRRGALLLEPESPAVADGLAMARRLKAAEIERVFAAEIAAAPELRAPLVAAGAWTAWEGLRRHQGLSERRALAAMRITFERLLGH